MSRFHRRHHPRHQTGKKLPPWAILLICAGAAILVTVLIGNLLRLWLDDETYHSLTDQKPPATTEEPYVSNVPRLNAYPFSVGSDLTEAASKRQLSLSINNPAGEICYRSPVADFQGRARQGAESLTEAMGALNAYGTYVSGVYYPQGFEHADPNLRYAAAVEDSAILREYLQMGGREILLIIKSTNRTSTEQVQDKYRTSTGQAQDKYRTSTGQVKKRLTSVLYHSILTLLTKIFLYRMIFQYFVVTLQLKVDRTLLSRLLSSRELSYLI